MAIQYANSENFKDLTAKGTVLVDFYADWCGPCQMIAPELEILAGKLNDNQHIVKLDVDKSQDIAMQFGVMSIPTLLLFKDGKKVDTKIGTLSADELEIWLNSFN